MHINYEWSTEKGRQRVETTLRSRVRLEKLSRKVKGLEKSRRRDREKGFHGER